MVRLSNLVLATAVALLTANAQAQGNLQATLDKLDAASARFTGAEAKVHREAYNALLKSIDYTQDGTAYFLRDKNGSIEMGLAVKGQNARTIQFKNGTLRDYNPTEKCEDTITRPGIDTYVTLGFGGSGKDLAKVWNITDDGPDSSMGPNVEKLELLPKDAGVRNNITKVTLWIDTMRDVTLKQIFLAPTRDTNTAIYSDIKLTPKPNTKPYEFKAKPCNK